MKHIKKRGEDVKEVKRTQEELDLEVIFLQGFKAGIDGVKETPEFANKSEKTAWESGYEKEVVNG